MRPESLDGGAVIDDDRAIIDNREDVLQPAFPFFVCFGRSGGSLIRAMLNAHSEIAVPEESFFVAELARTYSAGRVRFDVERFVADLDRRPAFRRWGVSPEALRAELCGAPEDYATAVRRLYRLYARNRGKIRYADRTNVHMFAIPTLAAVFRESRFVHLIRDGRDVALSWAELDFGLDRPEEVALHWVANVEAARRAGSLVGSKRYAEVHYERLVAQPEETLKELCTFLDLPYDAAMLGFYDQADEVMATSLRPEVHRGLVKPLRLDAREWRTDMPRDDVVVFESLAGDLLAALGYEVTSSPGRLTHWR